MTSAEPTIRKQRRGPRAAARRGLPADVYVAVHLWAVHHLAEFSPDSERFDPERFDPERFDPERFDPERFDPERFDPERFDPERFDPERFAEHRPEDRAHRNALPFGHGIHKCIGMYFGSMEVKAIMHQLLRRHELSVAGLPDAARPELAPPPPRRAAGHPASALTPGAPTGRDRIASPAHSTERWTST